MKNSQMTKFVVELTEDQYLAVSELLGRNIKSLEYFVEKYSLSHDEYVAQLRTGKYSSWSSYDKSRLPQVTEKLAFQKRLQQELAKARQRAKVS